MLSHSPSAARAVAAGTAVSFGRLHVLPIVSQFHEQMARPFREHLVQRSVCRPDRLGASISRSGSWSDDGRLMTRLCLRRIALVTCAVPLYLQSRGVR